MRWPAWTALAAAATLAGCPGFGDVYLSGDPPVSYTADIQPILNRWCSTCHTDPPTGGAPMALLTHAQVTDHLEAVRVRVLVQQTMPPGGGMDPAHQELLAAWISAGAPDDSPPDAGPPDGGAPPTWDTDIVPILATHGCAFSGCHGGEVLQSGLNLSSYQDFLAGGVNGPIHGDGVLENSRLIDSLYGRNGIARMPLGGGVSPAELATFEAWIQAGYPER